MSFIIDKQTLDDLGIFGRRQDRSVYGIYNSTHTRGGARILEEMFFNPLDDLRQIERRAALIDYFRRRRQPFPFESGWFDAAEFYLSNTDERTRLDAGEHALQKRLQRIMRTDSEFQTVHAGIVASVAIVGALDELTASMAADSEIVRLSGELTEVRALIGSPELEPVRKARGTRKFPLEEAARFDGLLRYRCARTMRRLLDFVYLLDVYLSVAEVAAARGFVRAEALPASENLIELKGVYHPMLSAPVANDLDISERNNIVFLTGANMAGKSTFMKTFGIALFLAHVGFPVPAASMRFSVRDGMYSTINLPDNLSRGYSHFYAEVRRLKKVAQSVNRHPNMIVIFDELFRGTNVKDAYDATVAVTEAFSRIRGSVFVISTHIIEAGEELRGRCANIGFVYLPTRMEGSVPQYTYRLASGITADRHGMMIVRNEGILEILGRGSGSENT